MSFFAGSTIDLVLLAVAAYVAVLSLVRMMLTERNRLGDELDRQIAAERARQAAEKRKAEKERRQRELEAEYERMRKRAA
jgi:Tfp pilus assembly protein PilN